MIGVSMRGLVMAAAAMTGVMMPAPYRPAHLGRPPVQKRRTAKQTHGGPGKDRTHRGAPNGLLQCGSTKGMRR